MSNRKIETNDSPSLRGAKKTQGPNMPFSSEHPLIEALLQIRTEIKWLHSSFTEQINEVKRVIQELADSQDEG